MTTHIGIGFSRHRDSQQAAREAATQAKTDLRAANTAWAMLLCTGHYDPQAIVPVVNETLRNPKLIGCSTTGIILSDSIETRSVAVLAVASDEMKFGDGFVEHIDTMSPQDVGLELAKRCLADFGAHGRQVFVFFVDSRLKNISPLLKSVQGTLGTSSPSWGRGAAIMYRGKILLNSTAAGC